MPNREYVLNEEITVHTLILMNGGGRCVKKYALSKGHALKQPALTIFCTFFSVLKTYLQNQILSAIVFSPILLRAFFNVDHDGAPR